MWIIFTALNSRHRLFRLQLAVAAGGGVSDGAKNSLRPWPGSLVGVGSILALWAAIIASAATSAFAKAPDPDQATSQPATVETCFAEATGFPSVDQQLCLGEHIPGFGGYDFEGPCLATVYLLSVEDDTTVPDFLRQNIAAASPDCGDDLVISIRTGDYNFADLQLWANQAMALLFADDPSQMPLSDALLGPFFLDNRITIFVDQEAFPGTAAQAEEDMAQAREKLRAAGFDLGAFRLTSDPFSSRALSWNLLGVSDPCVPVNPALAVCMDDARVQASIVDGTPTGVLGTAMLRSRQDIIYTFIVSWAEDMSLRDYARRQEEEMQYVLSDCTALQLGEFAALRFDVTSNASVGSPDDQGIRNPDLPQPRMVLFVETGAGIATIVGMPMNPEVPLQDLYSGAESVAGMFQILH